MDFLVFEGVSLDFLGNSSELLIDLKSTTSSIKNSDEDFYLRIKTL